MAGEAAEALVDPSCKSTHRWLAPLVVGLLLAVSASSGAFAEERFNGWFVSGFWANPLNTFEAVHGTVPESSAHLTGSLGGVAIGRGFQQGMLYYGFTGSFAGGVVEGQNDGLTCPANCYTSLNALGEATFSVGLVFWDRLLFRLGAGPNFAIMRSGQTFYGLHTQFVSGEHAAAGLEYGLNDQWSVISQVQRVRVGDLDYNVPTGHVGVNTRDFWLLTTGVGYRF